METTTSKVRDATINLRASRRQKMLIDRAASALGRNRCDFMLETACKEAEAVLYRQGEISGGKAAELLGLGREQFIRQASEQGIPYFQLDGEELRRELDASKKL